MTSSKPLSYKDAGVDISAGNALIERIAPFAKKTHRPEVLSHLGGFGALCEIPKKYDEPVLVSGTDGVGTKLRLAIEQNQHDNIGIDLVAMCVNDILVQGAEPLFFLDYYATGKLSLNTAETVIKSIAKGCEIAQCALIGGETAEMPGMYQTNDYDLAGFCVGVVEKSAIVQSKSIQPGDIILGLASSGAHANGFALIRKILSLYPKDIELSFDGQTLLEQLLAPTRIYSHAILDTMKHFPIQAMAHITGGGLTENIPRILPTHLQAVIDLNSWTIPALFEWIHDKGQLNVNEMLRTFNCGIGYVVIASQNYIDDILMHLSRLGETPWMIGQIEEKSSADKPNIRFMNQLV